MILSQKFSTGALTGEYLTNELKELEDRRVEKVVLGAVAEELGDYRSEEVRLDNVAEVKPVERPDARTQHTQTRYT